MTEVNEEFFQRKAEQDYHSAWREKQKEREKVFEESYLERRSREAGWLIKIEKPYKDEKVRPKTTPKPDRKADSNAASTQNLTAILPTSDLATKIFKRRPTTDEIEAQKRLKDAETLKEADRAAKRERYLQNNVKQIRVLERVIQWLSVPRQPAHHAKLPVSALNICVLSSSPLFQSIYLLRMNVGSSE